MLRQALVLLPLLTGLIAGSALAQEAALLQVGLDALKQGRYADAATALEQHTRLQPEDLKALQALAEAYLQLNQPDLAEVTLKAAHTIDRSDAQTHFLRGRLRLIQKDYLRARSEFRTLEYLKQTNGELWYQLALTYQALKDPDNARKALNEGLRDKTTSPDTSARLLLLQGELEPAQAESNLNLALQIQNLSPALATELMKLQTDQLIKNNRLGELIQRQMASIESSLKAKDIEAARRQLREIEGWLGKSEFPERDRLTYRKRLEDLYEKLPGQPLLRQQLILLYERSGLFEDLLSFYRIELQQNAQELTEAELGAAFHRMADVHLKMGYLQFAYDNYKLASDKNPRDFEAVKRMGVIFLVARDYSEAAKMFQNVLKEDPLDRENILMLSLAQAYRRDDVQARALLSQIPADVRPEVRAKVEALLLSELREPEKDIWQLLIPEDQILSQR